MTDSSKQELIFGVGNEINSSNELKWHQENIDTVIPVLIILAGVFQFVLRKYLLPVDNVVISKLENQLPTQGLIYKPGFGVSLIVIGILLLFLTL